MLKIKMDQRKFAVKGGILLHDENTIYNLTVEVDHGLKAVFPLTQSRALLKWTHFKLGGQQPLAHAAAKPRKITGEVSQLLFRTVMVRCVL